MTLFRNVVFVAAIAGFLAGIVMTGMQTFATVPLILKAETFENAMPAHDHSADAAAPQATETHDHGDEGWAPADGVERFSFTAAANIVTAIGFALVLVAVSEAAGGISGWRQGLFWGFAGFAVFTLAPGLGLPPELPAMPVAELVPRQIWWVSTVLATAVGLAMIALRRSPVLALAGVAIIVAPHLVGAPQPPSHETPIPEDLHHQFVVASTLTSLVFWVVLGALAGAVRERMARQDGSVQGSFA